MQEVFVRGQSSGATRGIVAILILPVGVLALAASGCGRNISAESPIVAMSMPVVEVAKPERRRVQRTVEIQGDVRPFQEAMLFAKVSGYLRTVLVDKGDRVSAGQLLATIESPELQRAALQSRETAGGAAAIAEGSAASRRRAESEYGEAIAAVSKAGADVAVSRSQVSKAVAERDAAAADVQRFLEQERQAEAYVGQAQGALTQARTERDLTRLTYSRLKKVYDQDPGLLARQDLDIAQARARDGEAKVVSAEQALSAARQGTAAAQQTVAAAKSKQAAAESGIEVARSQVQAAIQQQNAARAQGEAARSQIGVVKAQGRSAAFQSQASKQAARGAAEMLAYTEIRAPFGGAITQRFLDPGALVQSAANSAQGSTKPVLALAGADAVRIAVQVAEPDAPFVRPGTRATIQAGSGTKRGGAITRTSGALDMASRTMLSEIDLQNRDHSLSPGMFVKVTLDLEAHARALTVPTSAVVFEKDKRSVFIVEGGKAKKVNVKTGFEGPRWVEITVGLRGREDVIAVGKENVSSGSAVQVSTARP